MNTKKITIIILLVLSIQLIFCSSSSNTVQIQNLINNYSNVFDKKNFKAFSNFCTSDMLFYTLDGKVLDKNSMIPFLNKILGHWKNLHSERYDLDIMINSDMAWARYQLLINYSSSQKQNVMNNLITVIFNKINNKWKITHFHMSTSY